MDDRKTEDNFTYQLTWSGKYMKPDPIRAAAEEIDEYYAGRKTGRTSQRVIDILRREVERALEEKEKC